MFKIVKTRDVNRASRIRVVAPPYPYLLDKYLSRIYIRRISVMRVPIYFFHIRGYPRVPAGIYKII